MNPWLAALLPAIATSLALYFFQRAGHRRSTHDEATNTVTVSRPQAQVTMGILLGLSPYLALLVRWPQRDEVFPLLAFIFGMSAFGFGFAAYMNRKFVFSSDGIDTRGVRPLRIRWEDLAAIDARSHAHLDELGFESRQGQKVWIASTFDGWASVMALLPSLAEANASASKLVATAISELNRWKEPGQRYKTR